MIAKKYPMRISFYVLMGSLLLLGSTSVHAQCVDNDGDDYGVAGAPDCLNPGVDCDDTNANVFPGAIPICDGLDTNCDGRLDFRTDVDNDGDGVPRCANDCDDNDGNNFPGNLEICGDGKDNDCDRMIDTADTGGCIGGGGCTSDAECDNGNVCDGAEACDTATGNCLPGTPLVCNDGNACNGVETCDAVVGCQSGIPLTCDDGLFCNGTETCDAVNGCLAGINPCDLATENCNEGTDTCDPIVAGCASDAECDNGNVCDGAEACDIATGDCLPGTPLVCNDGDACNGVETCDAMPGCQSSTPLTCDDGQFCNGVETCDTTTGCVSGTAPCAPNACNEATDSCDALGVCGNGVVEAGEDCDGGVCCNPDCSFAIGSCDDGDPCTVSDTCSNGDCVGASLLGAEGPVGSPTCSDGCDNDSDGMTDGADSSCIVVVGDNDGDGMTVAAGDCDDTDPTVYLGAPRICDGKDNNCDGRLDFSTDVDADGDGVARCASDCDDANANRYPGNPEICTDGIDNDCDNLADAADLADCGPPSCDVVTTPRDEPHLAQLLNADGTIHPDNNALYCGKCHNLNNFLDDTRYQCQRCHADPNDTSDPLNGVLKALYPDPYPYGFGSAQNVLTHSSATVGNKYGNWGADCVNCHNPHTQEQDNKFGTSYGKLIKRTICFDNQATGGSVQSFVEFTAPTGPGSFADGAPYDANICNTCHTQTNHHQSDGIAPGGQDHNNGQNCMTCHAHGDGFSPAGGAPAAPHNTAAFLNNCDYCHVSTTDLAAPIPDTKCGQCHTPGGALKGSFPAAPDVLTHSGNACVDCHQLMGNPSNLKLVRSSVPGSIVPGSNIVFTARSGPDSFADGAPYNENICNTCHSATNHHQSDGTAPGGQSHNDSTDCTGCHAHGNAFLPDLTPPPAPHDAFACTLCHVTPDTYVFNADIPNCACQVCHTPSTIREHYSDTYTDPTTGQLVSITCVECHNPMREQVNFRNNTNLAFVRTEIRGNPIAFEARTGNYSFAADATGVADMDWQNYVCNTCHTQANHHQNDGTAPGGQSHNDGNDCATCHAHNDGFHASAVAPPPHNAFDCTVCHVTPDTYVPNAAIPSTACLGCHDGSVATAVMSHYSDHYVDPTTGALMDLECVACHNPMSIQTNFRGNTNLDFVRSDIRGTPVVFEATTGPYSFAADAIQPADMNTNNYVCNTCHTQTNHHQADGTAPGGQSHNDGSDCTGCHMHDAGFQPVGGGNCLACHNQSPPAGSSDARRRQVVEGTAGDGAGDFVRTSHHVSDGTANQIVTPDDCLVCHDLGAHMSFGDGVSVLLNDQDGGASFTYNGTPLSAEAFCLSCHDGNHPTPFPSDNNSPQNIENGWTASAHKSSGAASCLNCHAQGHGSDFEKILAQANDASLCFNCHDADGPASQNISAEFAKASAHSATLCKDCHDPHKATAANPIQGVSGVNPSTPGAGQTPSYTLVTVDNPDKQYQLCFKCHSDWGGGPTGPSNPAVDFNTKNDSYHWVENDRGAAKIYSGATFNTTWVGQMMPRYDGASNATLRSAKMRCSDCHGPEDADGGVTTPEGPHGSTRSPILKTPAGSPYTTWNASIRCTTRENDNASTCDQPVWCFNCHDPSFAGTGFINSDGGENMHIFEHGRKFPCQACHESLPHGSGGQGVGTANQRKHLLKSGVFREGIDNIVPRTWNQDDRGHNLLWSQGCT